MTDSVKQRISDYTVVNSGALKTVENILRRAGKDEAADELMIGAIKLEALIGDPSYYLDERTEFTIKAEQWRREHKNVQKMYPIQLYRLNDEK